MSDDSNPNDARMIRDALLAQGIGWHPLSDPTRTTALATENPDATRTQDPDWSDLIAMEREALHHEREAHRIRAEIRQRAAE